MAIYSNYGDTQTYQAGRINQVTLESYGKALDPLSSAVSELSAARDRRIEAEKRRNFIASESSKQRLFQSSENVETRAFTKKENIASREFTGSENKKGRDLQKKLDEDNKKFLTETANKQHSWDLDAANKDFSNKKEISKIEHDYRLDEIDVDNENKLEAQESKQVFEVELSGKMAKDKKELEEMANKSAIKIQRSKNAADKAVARIRNQGIDTSKIPDNIFDVVALKPSKEAMKELARVSHWKKEKIKVLTQQQELLDNLRKGYKHAKTPAQKEKFKKHLGVAEENTNPTLLQGLKDGSTNALELYVAENFKGKEPEAAEWLAGLGDKVIDEEITLKRTRESKQAAIKLGLNPSSQKVMLEEIDKVAKEIIDKYMSVDKKRAAAESAAVKATVDIDKEKRSTDLALYKSYVEKEIEKLNGESLTASERSDKILNIKKEGRKLFSVSSGLAK